MICILSVFKAKNYSYKRNAAWRTLNHTFVCFNILRDFFFSNQKWVQEKAQENKINTSLEGKSILPVIFYYLFAVCLHIGV